MYCEKCGLKRHFFSWRKICRRVWFFLWCLCIDAVRKRLLFLLFFAVYVGCAVIAHKIDGLAGADPSMPLSNSRERGLKLFFQDYSRGFFAASCRSCQAFFISADSRTSKLPLENLILIHSIWFLKCNQVQGRIFCSQKKSKRTRSSERKISLYVAK